MKRATSLLHLPTSHVEAPQPPSLSPSSASTPSPPSMTSSQSSSSFASLLRYGHHLNRASDSSSSRETLLAKTVVSSPMTPPPLVAAMLDAVEARKIEALSELGGGWLHSHLGDDDIEDNDGVAVDVFSSEVPLDSSAATCAAAETMKRSVSTPAFSLLASITKTASITNLLAVGTATASASAASAASVVSSPPLSPSRNENSKKDNETTKRGGFSIVSAAVARGNAGCHTHLRADGAEVAALTLMPVATSPRPNSPLVAAFRSCPGVHNPPEENNNDDGDATTTTDNDEVDIVSPSTSPVEPPLTSATKTTTSSVVVDVSTSDIFDVASRTFKSVAVGDIRRSKKTSSLSTPALGLFSIWRKTNTKTKEISNPSSLAHGSLSAPELILGTLAVLPTEVMLWALSYLHPADVRRVSETCVDLRRTIVSGGDPAGRSLWVELATKCERVVLDDCDDVQGSRKLGRAWPTLEEASLRKRRKGDVAGRCGETSPSPLLRYGLRRAASSQEGQEKEFEDGKEDKVVMPNLSVLLSLSPENHPSRVDQSFLEKRQLRVRRGRGGGGIGGGGAVFALPALSAVGGWEPGEGRGGGGGGAPQYVYKAEFVQVDAEVPVQQTHRSTADIPGDVAKHEVTSSVADGTSYHSFTSSSSSQLLPDSNHPPKLRVDTPKTVIAPVIRFAGQIGMGERCVRSDKPLPRPAMRPRRPPSSDCSSARSWLLKGKGGGDLWAAVLGEDHHSRSQFLTGLGWRGRGRRRRGNIDMEVLVAATVNGGGAPLSSVMMDSWRGGGTRRDGGGCSRWLTPFVAPYVVGTWKCGDDDDRLEEKMPSAIVDVTPRFVAYFEVSILSKTVGVDSWGVADATNTSSVGRIVRASDCVAVGLSTPSFRHRSRMPGWDRSSYGYHSDDGGLFHGSGEMVRRYGPQYGPGDTVGCGVDYVRDAIFFTLNGQFLGYAWHGTKAVQDESTHLYPTVGVDTNSPVACNFGERPFCFDLGAFVAKDKKLVEYSLGGLVQ